MPKTAPPRPAPDAASLHTYALAHLARFAATEIGLARVLARRVDRWVRSAEGDPNSVAASGASAHAAIPGVVARLAAAGAVSDDAFAQSRARSLARAGRSRRAIGAQLARHGVPSAMAGAALQTDDQAELAAALIHARKRRLGPWRKAEPGPETLRRELGSLARGGFAHGIAHRALQADRDEAEALIAGFRAGL